MKENFPPNHEYKVLLAEDNADWVRTVTKVLEEIGMTVALTVGTLEDALHAVALIKTLEIDLVILGGNLDSWPPHKDGNPDALAMLQAIQQHAPEVKTIGLSADSMPAPVTVDLGKKDANQLGDVVLDMFTTPPTSQE